MADEQWQPDGDTVSAIHEVAKSWRQGDVIHSDRLSSVVLFRSDQPLTQTSADSALEVGGANEVILSEEEVEAFVVTSQTCDVVENPAILPHITLSPLVRIENANRADEARRGYIPRYPPVPGEGDDAFADLARSTTIEKALLVGLDRKVGLRNDTEIRHFQKITQRHYGRFAFPDDLNPALDPLRKRLRDKKGKDSFEGRAIDAVEEIRLTALPDWSADSIDVEVYFLMESTQAMVKIEGDVVKWDRQRRAWQDKCVAQGCINAIQILLIPIDEFDVRSYLDSDPWDLGGMSPP